MLSERPAVNDDIRSNILELPGYFVVYIKLACRAMSASRPSHSDPVFGRINCLMHLTRKEDERGLVLSVGAFAEDLLGRLLLAYLRPGKSSSDLVEGFNAPLGTFSSRIKACHAFGIISDEQQRDLDIARKIRNEFAHNWEGCSFEKQNVRDLADALTASRIARQHPTEPTEKFRESISCVLIELTHLQTTLGPGGKVAPTVATHLGLEPNRGAR